MGCSMARRMRWGILYAMAWGTGRPRGRASAADLRPPVTALQGRWHISCPKAGPGTHGLARGSSPGDPSCPERVMGLQALQALLCTRPCRPVLPSRSPGCVPSSSSCTAPLSWDHREARPLLSPVVWPSSDRPTCLGLPGSIPPPGLLTLLSAGVSPGAGANPDTESHPGEGVSRHGV